MENIRRLNKLSKEDLIDKVKKINLELVILRKENVRIKEILNKREYDREYRKRPEVIAREEYYNQIPEVILKRKEYAKKALEKERRRVLENKIKNRIDNAR